MKKRLFYPALIAALAVNLFFGAQVYLHSAEAAGKDDIYSNLRLFTLVLERVREDYVDGDKLSYQELIYGALKGMIGTLDPHSEFMDAQKYDELKKETEGSFGGVGIQVGVRGDYLTVIAPMDDTPAARAGILPGDRIMKIDGKNSERFGLTEAVKHLRGASGTVVTLTILRPSTGIVKDFVLKREDIKVETVRDINSKGEYPVSDNKLGYIRISQFGEHTDSELAAALQKLKAQDMQGLILDLRDNPGGLLDEAVEVCSPFLKSGTLIVSTEGRDPTEKHEYHASGRDPFKTPMVVLVNGGSASASEIVAGCLQDLKRAVILGEQSFGKGSVQSIINLPGGCGLRLTTAKYYTPSHKVIHEKGITPDIVVPMSEEDTQAVFLKRTPGLADSLDPDQRERVIKVHDVQLDQAMDLLKGITLFTRREADTHKAAKVERSGKVAAN
ncbi:MAG: S41 family peptidase [Verrucomicrobiota bacterium]|jgi:carboxyl-terminal processing protease